MYSRNFQKPSLVPSRKLPSVAGKFGVVKLFKDFLAPCFYPTWMFLKTLFHFLLALFIPLIVHDFIVLYVWRLIPISRMSSLSSFNFVGLQHWVLHILCIADATIQHPSPCYTPKSHKNLKLFQSSCNKLSKVWVSFNHLSPRNHNRKKSKYVITDLFINRHTHTCACMCVHRPGEIRTNKGSGMTKSNVAPTWNVSMQSNLLSLLQNKTFLLEIKNSSWSHIFN